MYFEVCGNPYEGDLRIRDIDGHVVEYSDYDTGRRNDDAIKEFILSAVRDYLDDLHQGFSRPQSDSPI